MARQTIVRMVDDISGEEGEDVNAVEFTVDGKDYEIDLSSSNAARLREALAPFVDKARKAGGRVARATGAKMTVTRSRSGDRSREETAAIRDWARANGFEVSDRGRINQLVLDAYANRGGEGDGGNKAPQTVSAVSSSPTEPTKPTVQRKAVSGKTKTAQPTNGTAATMDELIAFRQAKGLPVGPDETTKGGALKAPVAKATREMMATG